ncbi:MAG TPA: VanZ family protein [Ruminiclostridium sp.]|nr:VanZ family protein [Ruminiclostridium sp.]
MGNHMKCFIDIIALIIIYAVFLFKKWKARGKDILLVNTLLYVYIALVLYVTLMPVIVSLPAIFNHPYVPMHMLPFDDYFSGRGDAERQILLNVIMMIPFGFLMPVVKRQSMFACALRTFLFSLCIELLQPLIDGFRSSDITDLITNTVGGVIGYLLYLLFKPLINTLLNRLKSNYTR